MVFAKASVQKAGSQKRNQKLARPSRTLEWVNPGLAALSWPGCSLCVLLGLIAVGLYRVVMALLWPTAVPLIAQGDSIRLIVRRSSVRCSLRPRGFCWLNPFCSLARRLAHRFTPKRLFFSLSREVPPLFPRGAPRRNLARNFENLMFLPHVALFHESRLLQASGLVSFARTQSGCA